MRSLSRRSRLLQARSRRESLARVPMATPKQRSPWWIPLVIFLAALGCASFLLLRRSHWDNARQQSIVVVQGRPEETLHSFTIVTFQGKDQSIAVLPIPDELLVDTASGYGRYKAAALEGLRRLEHQPPEFLTRSLVFQFGIWVDDIVWTNQPSSTLTRDQLNTLVWQTAVLQTPSTLGVVDRLKMMLYVRQISSSSFSILDVRSSGLVKNTGNQGDMVLDIPSFDSVAFQLFADNAIRREKKTVAVVNSSQEQKVGARVARTIANLGADVISVTSTLTSVEKTQVSVQESSVLTGPTVTTLQKVFSLPKNLLQVDPELAKQYRADVVLVVGKDWGQQLQTK